MATSRVTHTVENIEAGQRDSIRRARAKADGAKPEEYNNLPSDAEVNRAVAERQAEAAEASSDGESEDESSSSEDESGTSQPRRGPSASSESSGSEEG